MTPVEVTVRINVDAPDAKGTEPVVGAALARFGDSVVTLYPPTDYDKFPDCWDPAFGVQAADRPAVELAVEAARTLGQVTWRIVDADNIAEASPPPAGLPDDYEFDTLVDEVAPQASDSTYGSQTSNVGGYPTRRGATH